MQELSALSDDELTDRLKLLVVDESRCSAAVIEHLAEFDGRRLSEKKGYPSLFIYCVKVLGYAEGAAYKRIQAARCARLYPSIITRLEEGRITLNAVLLLSPHLTSENHRSLLDWARGKTRQELELKIASLSPRPDVADCVRRLPVPLVAPPSLAQAVLPADPPGAAPPQPARRSLEPLSPERVHFGFTADLAVLKLLERAREVLWHKFPAGRLEDIFREALEFLLDKKDPQRRLDIQERLKRQPPAIHEPSESRRIPQKVKDEVWRRDGGRCVYKRPDGSLCGERKGLEFDHVVPFSLGGPSNNPGNIRLLCRAHNQMSARAVFGDRGQR